jgi:Protein of unknown function (DUF2442)
MQPTSNTETDRSVEVAPAITHSVPWRVVSATVLEDARLGVTFVDGTAGEVDMRAFLRSPKIEGTVFQALRDPTLFAEVEIVLGAVQWPNGADLSPDSMYDAIRETGVWVLD